MKAVMLSIQPKWCELIASGRKTTEVRKTAPKLDAPFKCYIYCTNGQILYDLKNETYLNIDHRYALGENKSNKVERSYPPFINRKVIGEFVCDKVEQFTVGSLRWDDIERMACLSYSEMLDYFYKPNELDGKTVKFGYAWHISDLKIYDTPKELGEFKRKCEQYGSDNPNCDGCKFFIDGRSYEYDESDCAFAGRPPLTRPPQSWCYCEELSE